MNAQLVKEAITATAFLSGGEWTLSVLNAALQAPGFPPGLPFSPITNAIISIVAGGFFAGAAWHITGVAHARIAHFFPEKDPENVTYSLPPWPDSPGGISFVLGESHHGLKSGYSLNPCWYTLPAMGLYTGVAALGATGSAKTAGVLRPALNQFLAYTAADPAARAGGLIMDYKASLVAPTIEAATAAGRQSDLLIIGPDQPHKWNPIHAPELEPRVIAGRLLAILENMSGQSNTGKTAWIAAGASNIIEHAIGIIRQATNYITIRDLHEFVTGLDSAINASDTPAAAAQAYLAGFHQLFTTQQPDAAAQAAYSWHETYFLTEYPAQDGEYRAIYVSEITRITQYFADPKYRDKFSPPLPDIDFNGFYDAINTGKIVVLDANADLYGPLSNALGIFLKLDFQRAMLARPPRHRENPDYNFSRPMLLIIDEYQEFVSAGQTGDPQFFALSRESKAVCLVATQSRASLVQKIGDEKTRVLLASLRTKIFLALTDPADTKYAAEVCGEDWQQVENVNISESVQGAGLAGAGQLVGDASTVAESRSLNSQKVNRFEPVAFRDLPTFTAIVSGFDGKQALPPERILLKPYFRPKSETYRVFLEGLTT
jgi:hypothetical protein